VAYDKDLPPVGASKATETAYLDRELEKIRVEIENEIQRLDNIYEVLRAGGITTLYFWDDSLVMGDPGTGNMRGNNVVLQSVTQFAISKETVTQAEPPFFRLDGNDRMMVRNETANVSEIYDLDAPPVDNGTWWLFNVTHDTGAANNPLAGSIMAVIWFPIL